MLPEARSYCLQFFTNGTVHSSRQEGMNIFESDVIRVTHHRLVAFVVDDDPLIRDYVRLILQEQGYSVFVFESGIEALSGLADREGDVSVVITDVEMPGLDGIALAEEVNRRFCGIPVLMMSGSPLRIASARRRWAVFLGKPFMPAALIAAAQQAVVSARAA
jgi:DNA-binding NtrC family response regulator